MIAGSMAARRRRTRAQLGFIDPNSLSILERIGTLRDRRLRFVKVEILRVLAVFGFGGPDYIPYVLDLAVSSFLWIRLPEEGGLEVHIFCGVGRS